MILLLGIPSETPIQLLARACDAKKLAFAVFNQRRQEAWHIEEDFFENGNSILSDGVCSYRLDDCEGLYLRTMDHTQVPEYSTGSDPKAVDEMIRKLLSVIDGTTTCRVINPPSAQLSNYSKPCQLLLIAQHGFDIPTTCITSNEEEARQFIARHQSVIYKSISSVRSIVKEVDDASLDNLHKIEFCPVQFQERVSGLNLRVHVVGRHVFTTEIQTDAVDYRYAHMEGQTVELKPYELPDDVAEKCVSLAGALRLPFAGLDLMLTHDGRTICFEINPSPGYSYYEQSTGQLISYALADYLAFGSR
jgi:ribosomal protein S6-L-glutamate ligase RimK-like protein